jgi:hypothetical protein
MAAQRLPKLEIVIQIGESAPGTFAFENIYELIN